MEGQEVEKLEGQRMERLEGQRVEMVEGQRIERLTGWRKKEAYTFHTKILAGDLQSPPSNKIYSPEDKDQSIDLS